MFRVKLLFLFPFSESSSLGSQPKMVKFLANLSVTVLSVHCGRTHTLLYTNNGVGGEGHNTEKERFTFNALPSSFSCTRWAEIRWVNWA